MKRDIDLIRKIILAVEDLPTASALGQPLKLDGYSADQIGYHSFLIVDAGLAIGFDFGGCGHSGPMWQIDHLTSAGHDFADAAREDGTWRKALSIAKDKAGGLTIDVVKELLPRTGPVQGASPPKCLWWSHAARSSEVHRRHAGRRGAGTH